MPHKKHSFSFFISPNLHWVVEPNLINKLNLLHVFNLLKLKQQAKNIFVLF